MDEKQKLSDLVCQICAKSKWYTWTGMGLTCLDCQKLTYSTTTNAGQLGRFAAMCCASVKLSRMLENMSYATDGLIFDLKEKELHKRCYVCLVDFHFFKKPILKNVTRTDQQEKVYKLCKHCDKILLQFNNDPAMFAGAASCYCRMKQVKLSETFENIAQVLRDPV